MSPKRVTLLIVGVLLLAFLLASCQDTGGPDEVTRVVEVTRIVEGGDEAEVVEVTRIVEVPGEVPVAGGGDAVSSLPIVEQWAGSPHADVEAEAFVHWNEEDPAEVPPSCAKCHSSPGYVDFLGGDGTEAGVVDNPAPVGSVVDCEACHNDAAIAHDTVTFPSGMTIAGLTDEARCMECHQGRASKVQVDAAITELGADDVDAVNEELGFINIHYYAAAATQYGTLVQGGYEYEGKSYDARFAHVEPYDTCIDCHDPHTLEVQFDECTACHQGLESADDLVNIRTLASLVDYDGDGNMEEGVFYEIETLQEMLYATMQAYAMQVVGTGILYDSHSHPYFFADSDGSGVAEEGEISGDNSFASWTPRLLKAAYNYQVSLKDPGRYAHGGKYIVQLLYDSIEDLNSAVSEPVADLSVAHRIDHGHFAGSEEAFRHWDAEGAVPGTCSKCHSADGLPTFIAEGVTVAENLSNGLECTTCHTSLETFERFTLEGVEFPSGAVLAFEEPDANLCLNCHQGRAFGGSVDRAVGELADDELPEQPLRFVNVHYFAAGATLFGSQAHGLYQYEGQDYVGRFEHVGAFDTCVECHDAHALEARIEFCAACHEPVEQTGDLRTIRWTDDEDDLFDYDGDGNMEEGINGEIETMANAVYAALVDYTTNVVGTTIVYNDASYPYYFIDANANGRADADETEGYNAFTPRSLRAAYNYQYIHKDPGAFAHNARYVIQVLYDTLVDLGGDVSAMTRPETPGGG